MTAFALELMSLKPHWKIRLVKLVRGGVKRAKPQITQQTLQMQIFNKSFEFTVWGEVCFKHAPSHTNKRLRNLWLKDRLGRRCVIMVSLHLWRLKGASGILGRSGWGSFSMRGWQRIVRPRRNISSSCGTLSICSPGQNEAFSPHKI